MTNLKHTFVICAYKESEYLETCIQSLLNQTIKTNIIISTATPNDLIKGLANKYKISLYINEGEKGITQDWNFAYNHVQTPYVTIAHQDDFYEPHYIQKLISAMEKSNDSIIGFTDYYEIRNNNKVNTNKILKVKRILNTGFQISKRSRFVRNRILSIGNSICCPAVTFNKLNCGKFQFNNDFKVSCDWDAWSRLAKKRGSYVYSRQKLMGHRIYEESTTTAMIEEGLRYKEDEEIYRRYWPKFIVKLLMSQYKKSMDSNKL